MTDYVATRWYRSPELLFSSQKYTKAVDVWPIGCILAEMIGRKPLFPGTDNLNKLNLILDVIGTPTEDEIASIPNVQTRDYLKSLPKRAPKPLETLFKGATPVALNLLSRLLKFDPAKRITVEEALTHEYLKDLHYPPGEPAAVPVTLFDFDFEKYSLAGKELKSLIYDEVMLHNSEAKKQEYEKAAFPGGVLVKKGMGKLKVPKPPVSKSGKKPAKKGGKEVNSSDSDDE